MSFRPRPNHIEYRIPLFDGGLNTKHSDTSTPENQSPNLQNVVFDDFGAVGTCPGYTKLNGTAIASAMIDGLHEWIDTTKTRRLIAVCGGTAYNWGGSAFSAISGSTGLYTAGVDVNMLTVKNAVEFNNGSANPYKWDGTYWTRVGVSGVTAYAATAVCGGAGALVGTYQWAMTGVNSAGAEGDYTVITSALTITSGYATLSGIPSYAASFGVSTKNIYRTDGDTPSVFYKVTALTGAATSLTDAVADTSLVTQAPSDNGVAPVVKFMISHRNRSFGAGNETYPWRLYYSKQADQEIWPSENYLDIEEGDGLPIVGLAIYGNALFVHKNDGKGHGSLWSLYMPDSSDVTDDSNWYMDKVMVANAGIGHKSIAFYSSMMFYLNHYGGYAFQGQDIARSPAFSKVGVFPVDSLSFLIEPDWLAFNTVVLNKAAAIDFENKLWIALPSSASGYNNRIYQYDYRRASAADEVSGAWSVLSSPPVNCFANYDGNLYGGSAIADGFVYRLGTGTNFANGAIDSYFYTVWITGVKEHTDFTKVWRHLYLTVEGEGLWDLNVTYWVDYDSGAGTSTTVSLTSGGSMWDVMQWDNNVWDGGTNKKTALVVLNNAVGAAIQFKFGTNTTDQKFKIYDLKLEYNLRRVRQ